uniref:glycosyltransferase family 32 protein n=1 Tax=Methylobacterium sp. B34 TaxID=95563 RepID=UPI0005B253BB
MPIPKIVHLCWFGEGEKSKKIRSCEKSLEILRREEFEIMVWTEENYDVAAVPILRDAYAKKRWSLVSNYVRLDVLTRYGGVYLDCDVEIMRTFAPIIDRDLFLGFMWDCALGTAVIGCEKGSPIISAILNLYNMDGKNLISPNNNTFTQYFISNVSGFKLNGKSQELGNVLILDKYHFEQPSLFYRKNYAVHHFEQSWRNGSVVKSYLKKAVIMILGLYLYRRYVCWNSLRISPFRDNYLDSTR